MNYNWNWGVFFQTSPDGVHTYLATLLLGTGWTLATALAAWCMALALGSIGLAGFLWSLRAGQYEDLDGAALRILTDDDVGQAQ